MRKRRSFYFILEHLCLVVQAYVALMDASESWWHYHDALSAAAAAGFEPHPLPGAAPHAHPHLLLLSTQ
jgi:hypothetical protein